ncbi:hypothetical protein C8Q80DRAFT_1152555 [Daedaleopsis nitida]|nr:hypothetical protein C8Q80DRAFT_1152555 [Daedaleopsis nitida]
MHRRISHFPMTIRCGSGLDAQRSAVVDPVSARRAERAPDAVLDAAWRRVAIRVLAVRVRERVARAARVGEVAAAPPDDSRRAPLALLERAVGAHADVACDDGPDGRVRGDWGLPDGEGGGDECGEADKLHDDRSAASVWGWRGASGCWSCCAKGQCRGGLLRAYRATKVSFICAPSALGRIRGSSNNTDRPMRDAVRRGRPWAGMERENTTASLQTLHSTRGRQPSATPTLRAQTRDFQPTLRTVTVRVRAHSGI